MKFLKPFGIVARSTFGTCLFLLLLFIFIVGERWWEIAILLPMSWLLCHIPNPPFRKWYTRWEGPHPEGPGLGLWVQKRDVYYYYLFWNGRIFVAYFG